MKNVPDVFNQEIIKCDFYDTVAWQVFSILLIKVTLMAVFLLVY